MTEMGQLVRDEIGPEAQDFIHKGSHYGSEAIHCRSVGLTWSRGDPGLTRLFMTTKVQGNLFRHDGSNGG